MPEDVIPGVDAEPDEPAPETTTTTEPAVEITTGGTLVLATGQKGGHVNHGVASGVGVALPSSKIFAALVTLDSNWEPQPYLATDWNISDGGLTVTIDLVEGATFHDGEPITSEDVAYSIQVHQNNHPFTTMLAPVTGFDTSDPHQIVLTLDNPHPALFVALSDVLLPIIPKHIFDDGTLDAEEAIFTTAAAQGQTFSVSSGDEGVY